MSDAANMEREVETRKAVREALDRFAHEYIGVPEQAGLAPHTQSVIDRLYPAPRKEVVEPEPHLAGDGALRRFRDGKVQYLCGERWLDSKFTPADIDGLHALLHAKPVEREVV